MQLFSRLSTTSIVIFLLGVSPSVGARSDQNHVALVAPPAQQNASQLSNPESSANINATLSLPATKRPASDDPALEYITPLNPALESTQTPAAIPPTTPPTTITPITITPTPPSSVAATSDDDSNAVDGSSQIPVMERAELIKQRKIYQSAHSALKKGQRKTFRRHYKKLTAYPLKPYLRYYEIRRYLSSQNTQTVNEFIDQHNDLAVTPFLRVAWLKKLAKQGRWQEYLDFYQPSKSAELQCHYIWAQYKTGTPSVLEQAKPLWVIGKSQPSACDPLFDAWKTSSYFDRDYIWQRFELAMGKRKLSLATYLSNSFSGQEAKLAQEWLRVHRNPRRLASTQRYLADSEKSKQVVLNGLIRLINKSPEEAIALWAVYESALTFSEAQQQQFSQAIATILTLRFLPNASEWLTEANPVGANSTLNQLAIRVALRELRWNEVILLIQQLPKQERLEARWQYWYARALKQLDISDSQNTEANLIFLQLAQATNYYGFLAKEQLQQPFQFNPPKAFVSNHDLKQLERIPAVQRAREFYLLGRPADARREWAGALSKLTDAQRLVAATLASQRGWHNQAIRSMARTSLHHHLELRYPRAFQESVNYFAKSNELPNDWVYAISRQESLFTPDARSPAGALGLMQLLPSTAKLVARRIGANYRGKQDLLLPEKNIRLGTSYMRQLLTRFNENTVLATAAYNAGPHRVKRWLPEDHDLPADVWIETIPFKETRHYVKKVLTNRVIYKYQLGREPELASSIPTIFSPSTDG